MADEQTKEPTLRELKERAAELDISGRSEMDKDELAEAIQQAEMLAEEQSKADAPRYSHDQLVEIHAKRIGHPPHVVAGALSDLQVKDDLTISQAQTAVEEFLNRPLKEDA